MKIRVKLFTCLLVCLWFFISNSFAQKLEPYGLQGKSVTALAYYGGALYAGANGDGLFVHNPFNATTVIPFKMFYPSFVALEIYNITGKKVRTLVADQKPVGHFEVQWDGTDEWDQAVASEIYFCRLQATWQSREAFV